MFKFLRDSRSSKDNVHLDFGRQEIIEASVLAVLAALLIEGLKSLIDEPTWLRAILVASVSLSGWYFYGPSSNLSVNNQGQIDNREEQLRDLITNGGFIGRLYSTLGYRLLKTLSLYLSGPHGYSEAHPRVVSADPTGNTEVSASAINGSAFRYIISFGQTIASGKGFDRVYMISLWLPMLLMYFFWVIFGGEDIFTGPALLHLQIPFIVRLVKLICVILSSILLYDLMLPANCPTGSPRKSSKTNNISIAHFTNFIASFTASIKHFTKTHYTFIIKFIFACIFTALADGQALIFALGFGFIGIRYGAFVALFSGSAVLMVATWLNLMFDTSTIFGITFFSFFVIIVAIIAFRVTLACLFFANTYTRYDKYSSTFLLRTIKRIITLALPILAITIDANISSAREANSELVIAPFFILSVVTALPTWLSVLVTKKLIEDGMKRTNPLLTLVWSIVDLFFSMVLAFAVAAFIVWACTILYQLFLLRHLHAAPSVIEELEGMREGQLRGSEKYYWIYLLILSIQLPAAANFVLSAFSSVRGFGAVNEWMINYITQNDAVKISQRVTLSVFLGTQPIVAVAFGCIMVSIVFEFLFYNYSSGLQWTLKQLIDLAKWTRLPL